MHICENEASFGDSDSSNPNYVVSDADEYSESDDSSNYAPS